MQRTGEINENELEEGSADTPSRPKLQRNSTIDVTVKVNPSFYCEKCLTYPAVCSICYPAREIVERLSR